MNTESLVQLMARLDVVEADTYPTYSEMVFLRRDYKRISKAVAALVEFAESRCPHGEGQCSGHCFAHQLLARIDKDEL